MVAALSLREKNPTTINQAIRELQNGRNNATGTVTLTTGTSTTVPAPNCSPSCIVLLQEITADAAAARYASPWVLPTAQKGQFTLAHAAGPNDRTFWWICLGGN